MAAKKKSDKAVRDAAKVLRDMSAEELRGKLAELKVGDSVDVVVLRGGAEETIHMTLEEIPEENR